jgi:hypothetical protein
MRAKRPYIRPYLNARVYRRNRRRYPYWLVGVNYIAGFILFEVALYAVFRLIAGVGVTLDQFFHLH